VGHCPTPRKLFEKSLIKNFKIKTAHMRGFGFNIKVFGQAFFKKLAGCGAAPHGFSFVFLYSFALPYHPTYQH